MRAVLMGVLLASLAACGTAGLGGREPARSPLAGKPILPPAPPPPQVADEGIVCPADVRQCPDGSYVIRDPARACAFNPCPGEGGPK